MAEKKKKKRRSLLKSMYERSRARQAKRRLKRAGVKVSKKQAAQSGKVRLGVKAAEVTKKGGAFPKYKKKSMAAGSFRKAFASNCKGKGAGDSFSWDGRSYSCARASDKKKKPKQAPKAPKSAPKNKVVETSADKKARLARVAAAKKRDKAVRDQTLKDVKSFKKKPKKKVTYRKSVVRVNRLKKKKAAPKPAA